jgi:hypothetical protein
MNKIFAAPGWTYQRLKKIDAKHIKTACAILNTVFIFLLLVVALMIKSKLTDWLPTIQEDAAVIKSDIRDLNIIVGHGAMTGVLGDFVSNCVEKDRLE